MTRIVLIEKFIKLEWSSVKYLFCSFIFDKMQNIKSRLQFLTTLALFFPVTLEAFFSLSEDPSIKPGMIILGWGSVIAVLIIVYLVVELFSEKFSIWALKILNWLILGEIFLFVPAIFLMGAVAYGAVESFANYIIIGSFQGLIVLPLCILAVAAWDVPLRSMINSFKWR